MASATVGQDDDDSADCAEARALFERAGLAFPAMPAQFRRRLGRHGRWVYATRPIGDSPYMIDSYVEEAVRAHVPDYALLAHAGHGVNSYAIHLDGVNYFPPATTITSPHPPWLRVEALG